MKRVLFILAVLVSGYCYAVKYTPEMYEKAISNVDTLVVYVHDTVVVRDTVVVHDTIKAEQQKPVVVAITEIADTVKKSVTKSVEEKSVAGPQQKAYRDEDGKALQTQYHIVLGVFQSKLNAQNLVDNIMQKGEGSPSISIGPDGLFRVFYFSSDSETEARQMLVQAKEDYPSAWLLNIRK